MPLYFAYGSNMSRALMRRHCPHARPLGTAVLDHHRFIVMADGYASIVRHPGHEVHGVLWQLTPRDVDALNAYESIDTGLYCRRVRRGLSTGLHRAFVAARAAAARLPRLRACCGARLGSSAILHECAGALGRARGRETGKVRGR